MFLFHYKDLRVRKCVTIAMARKNMESPRSGLKTPPRGQIVTPRSSPSRSPRDRSPTSPMSVGHYAGCKWTEPPSPSALPSPPQHWMQASRSIVLQPLIQHNPNQIENHLKMLLDVQA